MRCSGKVKPEFLIAERTVPAFADGGIGQPTMANPGSPNCTSTSTETG